MRHFRLFATALKMPNAAILPSRFGPDGEVWFGAFGTLHLPARLLTP